MRDTATHFFDSVWYADAHGAYITYVPSYTQPNVFLEIMRYLVPILVAIYIGTQIANKKPKPHEH